MLQNGPKCYRLNVRAVGSQHTHQHAYVHRSHLYIQCVLYRLCACYQIIAISASLIEIWERRWIEMNDEWEFYGEILSFFSSFENRTHLKFFRPTHTLRPENKWMGKKQQGFTFNSIFLSKNPKTISIRKLQTSFHFHYYYISIVSFSLALLAHTSSFFGSHSTFACKCFMNTRVQCKKVCF